ncbi:uracil-DNA glycosylase family 4 [Bradyrhizobium sp. LB7.2]
MIPEPAPTVRELLAFYLEAGVDCALAEEPTDRLAELDTPPPAPRAPPPVEAPRPVAAPAVIRGETAPAPDIAIASAREAARTAPTLEALRELMQSFDGCALKHTATRLVFADGNPQARIMFVGEAPGRDEDIEGLPFVGRSGKLLDLMIGAIGLNRTTAYIANVIPWRPPGNRTPTPQETQICLPFIQRQIELVNPDVLVSLGNPATQTLLSTREGIMRTRGRWFDYETAGRTIRALPTFHPAYLLRSPSYKRLAWQDLRAIAKILARDSPLVSRTRCSAIALLRRAGTQTAATWAPALQRITSCCAASGARAQSNSPSAARWPSRYAGAAGVRSPAIRRRAALPGRCRESAPGFPAVGCRRYRRRARPRRRRSR